MDWLAKHQAVIACAEKVVRIPWKNKSLIIHGDGSTQGNVTRLNIISCTKTQKYMEKGFPIFLAHVTTKEIEDKSEKKRLEDVPIVQDFPEVFPEDLPGLPPTRQVEFQIDLKNKPEHKEHLKQYLGIVLRRKSFYANFSKCEFGFLSAPILALPEGSEDFIAYCDASKKGLALGICSQDLETLFIRNQVYSVHRSQEFATHFRSKRAEHEATTMLSCYVITMRYTISPGEEQRCSAHFKQERREPPLRVRAEAIIETKLEPLLGTPVPQWQELSGRNIKAIRLLVQPKIPKGIGITSPWISSRSIPKTTQNALGTNLDMSTAYHPQTDGQSERTIQTLEDICVLCIVTFRQGWVNHLQCTYGSKCRSPVCWTEVGEAQILGPELIQETTEKIIQIKQRMQAARDRQKSYADLKRKPMEFQVGDKVMLKVSPWKGVVRFGKRGKLNPSVIRPFLSTAHAKIDVFKRKITLRVGKEKIIFKSVKPASSLIKRVYMLSLRERMELDLEARLMGETLVLNRSLDPFFGDYIELNDLNVPLELRRDQVDDLMPTIEEGGVVEEFKARNDARMVSNIFGYPSDCDHNKNDKLEYKGNNVVGALMNIPIFVGTFSILTDFVVLEDMDSYRDEGIGDVIFGEPFLREVGINAKRFEGMITIHDGNEEVTYQMVRSHPRFKHHTNEQCNKTPPLLKVSKEDKMNGISHSYQKLKGFYKGVLNLGPNFIRVPSIEEWLTRGHINVHEIE
ncbi:homeodomain-like protein [Tanacetum coccineum]